MLGALTAGLTALAVEPADADATRENGDTENFILVPNGSIPNNPRLPVLLGRGALTGALAAPDGFERRVAATGWPAQWRNGIYTFHHYHSTAHEVLGIVSGEASVFLGGPGVRTVSVRAGDLLLLPAGTGHCLDRASDDFLVIGAYPAGQHWDICRDAPDRATLDRMAALPFPHTDPIGGVSGALPRFWL